VEVAAAAEHVGELVARQLGGGRRDMKRVASCTMLAWMSSERCCERYGEASSRPSRGVGAGASEDGAVGEGA